MIKSTKRIVTGAAFLLTIGLMPSCKHDAGVLDKCLGKNISLDTTYVQNNFTSIDTTTNPKTPGELILDTNGYYIKADKRKTPYTISIDGGKTWKSKFPIDTVGFTASYKVIIKDADGCLSPTYTISLQ